MGQFSVYCGYWFLCLATFGLVLCTANRCPESWVYHAVADHCYLKSSGSAYSYNNSQQACAGHGGTLASAATLEVADFLYQTVIGIDKSDYWIGLWKTGQFGGTLQVRRQNWQWLDGSDYSWMHWYDGRDDEPSGESGCARIREDGYWGDTFCYRELKYICKKRALNIAATTTTSSTTTTTTYRSTTTTSTSTPRNSAGGTTTLKSQFADFTRLPDIKSPTPPQQNTPSVGRTGIGSEGTTESDSAPNRTLSGNVKAYKQDVNLYLFVALPAGGAIIIVLAGVSIGIAHCRHRRKMAEMVEKERRSRAFVARMKAAEARIGIPSSQPSPPSSLADLDETLEIADEKEYANDREYPFHADIPMEDEGDDGDLLC